MTAAASSGTNARKWPRAGIDMALRDAVHALAVNGRTRVECAKAWFAQRRTEQVPSKYDCRTWPHVMHESRLPS